jgi:hypothetical protein
MYEMKRIKIVGLCLVAVFAFGALTAASAFAEGPTPEFKTCVKAAKSGKTYTGAYSNKTCTEANATDEGKYEREEVANETPFTSKSKAATFTVDGKVVKCKKDTDTGTYTHGDKIDVTITFSDCETSEVVSVKGKPKTVKVPCTTGTEASGTIKTSPLSGTLEYITAAEEEAALGVVLYRYGATGAALVEFKCGAESFAIKGGIAASVANTSKGQTLTFAVNGSGEQEYKTFWTEEEAYSHLGYTEPGHVEATLATVDEQSAKGIGAF